MVAARRLRIGLVIDGTDHFLRPIEAELRRRHQVARFAPRFVRLPLIGQRVNDRLLVRQLGRFLGENDVVFCEWAGPLATMASHLPGAAARIVRAHRTELFSELETFDWARVDRVIFVSGAMQKRFLQRFPEQRRQTLVVYNGVDLQRFSPSEAGEPLAWRIGMLGSLTPRKRAYDVICALADLSATIPWRLSIGGQPVNTDLDYWEALQTVVSRLGIGSQVIFAGLVTNPADWLKGIDVFVSASYSEGHQVALLEAMAAGCYCLGHCWDGIEEILPPENIYTTDGDLRAKLIAYAALPQASQRAAQAQMRAIAEEKFDERRMVRQIVELIEQVAGK